MLKMFKAYILSFFLILLCAQNITNPTWSQDPDFQSKTQILIFTPTPSPYTNTFTISYLTAMTSNPPFLGIGLNSYVAEDFLLQQFFSLNVNSWDNVQMAVQLDMEGITTPSKLYIRYILVQTSYPKLINFFLNIDLNFTTPLSNITTMSDQLQSHTQHIDFTTNLAYYAIYRPTLFYDTFTTPLTDNKIQFYLTALHMLATSTVPVQIDISYNIIDTNNFDITATVGYNVSITKLTFTIIMYNSGQYDSTTSPYLNAYQWTISDALSPNNIIYFNTILSNQFMIGLKSFITNTGQVNLTFDGIIATYTNGNGLRLDLDNNQNITSVTMSVMYMMTWTCPGGYPYLNLDTMQCQDICGYYTYANITDMTCRPCSNSLCYTCDTNNSNICLSCPDHFTLSNDTCICPMTGLDRVYTNASQCQLCSDILAYCISCQYSGNSSLPFNSSLFTCIGCNNSAGYFIDTTDTCSTCSVANCQSCSGYSICSTCNSGYGVTISGQCSTCPLPGCSTCVNISYCANCTTGYQIQNGTCNACASTCTCGGYMLPKYANGDCRTVCGDGILIGTYEQCDDGNVVNGDGCSSQCNIEEYSTCGGSPSLCYLNGNIHTVVTDITVSTQQCNVITFTFKIMPNLPIFYLYPTTWTTFITTPSPSLTPLPSLLSFSQGYLSSSYLYSQTLQNTTLTFNINPVGIVNSTYLSQVTPFTINSIILPTNNVAAVYYNDQICNSRSTTQQFVTAQIAIGYIGLFCSLFSMKIAGLQMFGTLQLSYFILADYNYISPVFIGAINRKEVNGINLYGNQQDNKQISDRVELNGYQNQSFLAYFNIMLYLMFAVAVIGMVLYIGTYIAQQPSYNSVSQTSSLKQLQSNSTHLEHSQSKSTKMHKISKYLLKEVLLTLLLFNMFNLSFSAGIQIKYIDNVDPWAIIAMLLSFGLVIAMIVGLLKSDKIEFGEYLDKFKQNKRQTIYITITIIYRFILGILMALLNQWPQAGIIFVLISGTFLGYIFWSEPFLNPLHNLRSKIIQSSHVLILFVNYLYRLQSQQNVVQSNIFLFPAYLLLVTVGIVVIGSTLLLIYQLIKFIKEKIQGREEKNNQTVFQTIHVEEISKNAQQREKDEMREVEVEQLDS